MKMMVFALLLLLLNNINPSRQFDNKQSHRPIQVIDIFTNYPSPDAALKEYQNIQQKRQGETLNASTRNARDYDDYYDKYHPDYDYHYKDHYNNKYKPEVLESEFGVFDDHRNSEDDTDRYVYLQGQKFNNYRPADNYNVKRPYGDDEQPDNFKNKLDKFIAAVENRPNFQTTKRNYTNYFDQFNFQTDNKFPSYFQNVMHNDLNVATRTTTSTTTPKPTRKRKIGKKNKPKPNPATPNPDSEKIIIVQGHQPNRDTIKSNDAKQRVTNILRRYLVNMHRRKGTRDQRGKQHDRTIASTIGKLLSDKKTQIITNYKIDAHKKYITEPLESLKNKTKLFANKFLSLFTVVQFSNAKCQASSALSEYEGTCFLATECAAWDGIAMGNCAEGHGVCCVFKGTCGDVGSQNCTYFESPNYPNYFPGGGVVTPVTNTTTGQVPDPRLPFTWDFEGRAGSDEANALSCIFKVYKANDNIKQMRIDFIDLELAGSVNGVCSNERLIISGTGLSMTIPIICGYNTGQHVYVDVSSLSGPLQLSVLANSIDRKRYKLKICQYSDGCSGSMNCLQSYTGVTGTISSFNYDQAATFSRSNPEYFNNLNYAICIRREPGYCTITYTNVDSNGVTYPFQLRNYDDDGLPTVPAGQAGVGVINCPDDYIVINGIRLCGDRLNDGSSVDNFELNAPVTDFSGGPIIVPVRTSSTQNGRGFKLFYTQNRCTTSPGGGVPDPRI